MDIERISAVAAVLANHTEAGFDWLENLSVVQIDEAILITYFLHSRESGAALVLRGSIGVPAPEEYAKVRSVRSVWPMAAPLEDEAAALFGIEFFSESSAPSVGTRWSFIAAGASEPKVFPMRKRVKTEEKSP